MPTRITRKKGVPGLYYVKEALTPDDSAAIIAYLDSQTWSPLSNSPRSRKVQHYGFKQDYNSGDIRVPTTPIPPQLSPPLEMLTEVTAFLGLVHPDEIFNQCIVNNYEPSQGITPHVDVAAQGDVIGCFTVGSGATMRFTQGPNIEEVYVEPNSLYIMSGDARHYWRHAMPVRKTDVVGGFKVPRSRRISLTFRHVPPECV